MCGAQNASESFCIAEIWQRHSCGWSGRRRQLDRWRRDIKKGPLGKTNGPSLGRKRPRWATTHREDQTCRYAAYGLVRGAVQLRRSGSGYISACMWLIRNETRFFDRSVTLFEGKLAPRPVCLEKTWIARTRCQQIEIAVTTDRTTASRAHLEFAHVLADISADAILPYFRKPLAVGNKAGPSAFDPVTAADRAAERAIRKAVLARFPDHGYRRRGVRRRRRQGPLPLVDRSDRRHAGLHHRAPRCGER